MFVPYMAKFVVLGKAQDSSETRLRVFCIVDEKWVDLSSNILELIAIPF